MVNLIACTHFHFFQAFEDAFEDSLETLLNSGIKFSPIPTPIPVRHMPVTIGVGSGGLNKIVR